MAGGIHPIVRAVVIIGSIAVVLTVVCFVFLVIVNWCSSPRKPKKDPTTTAVSDESGRKNVA